MRAEIAGLRFERLLPACDSRGERLVDILKGLLGRALGVGIASLADAVEDAPRLRLLFGLEAEECIFERCVLVCGIQAHSLAKLIARGVVLSNLEQRVGAVPYGWTRGPAPA